MVSDRPYVQKALEATMAAYHAVTHMGVSDCDGDNRRKAMEACLAANKFIRDGDAFLRCANDHRPDTYDARVDGWVCACRAYEFQRVSR